jgi:two-component system sensor histidine kinase AgrC
MGWAAMSRLEISYEVISQLYFLGTLAAAAYCYYRLVRAFLPKRRPAWPVGAAYLAVMLFLYAIPLLLSNFLAYTLGMLAGLLVMYLLDKSNPCQKIFLAVTFFSLRWMAYSAETTLSQLANALLFSLPGVAGNGQMQLKIFILQSVLDGCLSFALMLGAVLAIQKVYRHKRERMTVRELALLFIPSLSSIAGYAVLQSYRALYERDAHQSFYDAVGLCHWIFLFYYLVSFLTILAAILLFQTLKNRQEEERENRLLLEQVEEIKRHISGIERIYGDMRSLRHDMRNHILTLEHLCAQRSRKAAGEYLKELKEQLGGMLPENISGNPVTDVILAEWRQRANERGIAFDCCFHYPQESAISAFDVSVLLNNALSNALAGAEKSREPFIRIRSRCCRNTYLLEISNSFSGEILWNEESGLPESSQTGPGHGLGLCSIRRIAQKYFGDIDISADESCFTLSILLMSR